MTSLQSQSHEVSQLLIEWSEGNQAALDRLMPMVYQELRRLAHQYLNKERKGRTLQTSDLVHEAYLRLVDQRRVHWQNRAHFYGIAAELMRRILVDRARRRRRIKRGGDAARITLDQDIALLEQPAVDVIAIDEVLTKLAHIDKRKARIVELRFFGGLEVEETAAFLEISERTVMREWKMAKAWLHRELSNES
jgi:RNA polymerase sigma factor (TIGR02999 family)